MEGLREIVKNKRVAIIGPSKGVIHNKREHIEEYDIIVRLNEDWPVNPKLRDAVGERVDILYHAYGKFANPMYNDCLVVEGPIPEPKMGDFEELGKQAKAVFYGRYCYMLKDFLEEKSIYHTHLRPRRLRFRTKYNFLSSPTTGFLAVCELLECNLKELYITGFTFYREPYHSEHNPTQMSDSVSAHWNNSLHHNPVIELQFFKDLYDRDLRIKVDNRLCGIVMEDTVKALFDEFGKSRKVARELNFLNARLPERATEWTHELVDKLEVCNESNHPS
tara:strand:+ start:3593 stop:4423 length:831 start_codon:yes stop_codon:yes gene_type:complete